MHVFLLGNKARKYGREIDLKLMSDERVVLTWSELLLNIVVVRRRVCEVLGLFEDFTAIVDNLL